MAQTKRKRRSKHRGTAAGNIETRGRTGRRTAPDPKEKRRQETRERRANRLDQPPNWKSAAYRGLAAAAVFFVLVVVLFDQPVSAGLYLAGFMTLFYIPLGYYTDLIIYKRRQRKQQGAAKR